MKIQELAGIQPTLKTHLGRKKFSMIVLNVHGYSVEALSKMCGHTTTKQAEIYYTNVKENRVISETQKLRKEGKIDS
jgi:site-specific recombinase XerD